MLHRAYNRAKGYPAEDLRLAILAGQEPWLERQTDSTFSCSADDQRWQKAWNGGWMGCYPLGELLTSSPAVASWAPNWLDVFVRPATTRSTGDLRTVGCDYVQ